MGRAGYVFPYGVVPDMCWLLGGEILACVLHFSRLICKTKPHEAKPKQDLYLGDVLQQVIPEESHGAGSAWRFGAVAASTEERPWGLWQCGKVGMGAFWPRSAAWCVRHRLFHKSQKEDKKTRRRQRKDGGEAALGGPGPQ